MLGGQTSRNLGRSLQSRQQELQTLLTLGTANNIWLHGDQGTAWGHQSEEPQGSVWSWDLAARAGSTTAGARGCAGFRRNKMPPPGGGGTSTNRSVFSHRSGGQTSKSQVWAGPLSIPGSGHSPSLPLPPFFLLVGSLARSDVTPICLCGHTPSPLWVPMSSPGASPAHVSLLLLQGHPLHGVEGPPSSRVISSSPVTSATIRFPIRSHSGVLGVRT